MLVDSAALEIPYRPQRSTPTLVYAVAGVALSLSAPTRLERLDIGQARRECSAIWFRRDETSTP